MDYINFVHITRNYGRHIWDKKPHDKLYLIMFMVTPELQAHVQINILFLKVFMIKFMSNKLK